MEEHKKDIFIIGHKNPDTDSICSAIAYAYLKNQMSKENYIPSRAGQLNGETQYVLKRFKVDPPLLLDSVETQVKDIEYRRAQGVTADMSLKAAWNMMREVDLITLPIVENEKLKGLITVSDIATAYMDASDNEILSKAGTTYDNIIKTLGATLCIGSGEGKFSKGKVLIAAANPDLMEDYIEPNDLVILGNRYESQLCAIEMDASCLIICEGAKVSLTIKKLAEERNCTVLSTPYDTFTVARLLNQSMPIGYFMRSEGLMTFNLEEKIDTIKDIMTKKRHRYFPIVDDDGNYEGMISRRNFLNMSPKSVIMVDHNEKNQAIDGIEDAEILEIIDHHRLRSVETMSPVFFRNQPLGCTASIIYQMFNENGVEIPAELAGILCAAIISDTVMFRSPTCTAVDKAAGEALAQMCGADIELLASAMFNAGSQLRDKSDEEIFNLDLKKFTSNGVKFAVGQVSVMSDDEVHELEDRMLSYMKSRISNSNMQMVYFMLTNITKESTKLLFVGDNAKSVVENALDEMPGDESVLLPGVISRKKQLIPYLMGVLNQ